MKIGKWVGLSLLGGGILLLLFYGLYHLMINISGIDSIIAIGIIAIVLGSIILIIAVIAEQVLDMKEEKKKIKKEDLEP